VLIDVVLPPAERGQNQRRGQQPNLVPIGFCQFWNGPQEATAQLSENGEHIYHGFSKPVINKQKSTLI